MSAAELEQVALPGPCMGPPTAQIAGGHSTDGTTPGKRASVERFLVRPPRKPLRVAGPRRTPSGGDRDGLGPLRARSDSGTNAPAASQDAAAAITFYKDVLPVLQKNCQTCHRPGQIGPFSMLTFTWL